MTAPRRQNVSQVAAEIIRRLYEYHGAGCCWHCVLDDDNWHLIAATQRDVLEPERISGRCRTRGACAELARLDLTPSILVRARKRARV